MPREYRPPSYHGAAAHVKSGARKRRTLDRTEPLPMANYEPPSTQETISLIQQAKALQARIVTKRGDIVFSFYPDDAPTTVASFIKLARSGFYDGLTFHRVEPGF